MEQGRYNAVGAIVRRLRTQRNLTQEMLSARCGVAGFEIPRRTLAKIEAGIRCVTDVELFVLARVLGVPLEALFPPRFASRLAKGEFAESTG